MTPDLNGDKYPDDENQAARTSFTLAESQDGKKARPSSLIPVHRSAVIDPLHELNLHRMLQIANERTMREFGPLPPGGLAVTQKCKPAVPYRDFLGREVREEPSAEENNEMKLSQLAAATALTAGVMAGCADPKHPALNPHPKQRYEITLTIEGAPGSFESVTGYLYYTIANGSECAPQDPLSGVYESGPGYRPPIAFHRVAENTYRALVYVDIVRDENYYGKGICHWQFNGLSASLENRGVRFGMGLFPGDIAMQKARTGYIPKRLYADTEAQDQKMFFLTESISEEIATHRDGYFSLTLTAKEGGNE